MEQWNNESRTNSYKLKKRGEMAVLDELLAHKRREIEQHKRAVTLEQLKKGLNGLPPTRSFKQALAKPEISLIAEIKKASPSAGIIRENFDPIAIAETYEKAGASALSVLTEKRYFQGDTVFLNEIRKFTSLPLLRKDFIIDAYQVYRSRIAGADAILLIAAILSKSKLKLLLSLARQLQLDVLVEVSNKEELEKVLETEAEIIGINNRNLRSLKVDLRTTFDLVKNIPDGYVVVSESGIKTREDVIRLQKGEIEAILVGESLLRSEDIKGKVRELLGK